jgi:hypothetical protein
MTTFYRCGMSFLSCVMLVFFMTGCFPKAIYLPEKFSAIEELFPADVVKAAQRAGTPSIAYTYSEPITLSPGAGYDHSLWHE